MQKKIENLFSVIVAITPALAVYSFLPGLSLAFFLVWLCFIPLFFVCSDKNFNYDEVVFLFCICFISIISFLYHTVVGVEWFDSVLFYHNMFGIMVCLIPLCFVTKYINTKVFVNAMFFWGIVASVILIWQWLSLFFWGSFQNDVFIPGLKVNRDLETFSLFRPSAFFTEPAHFSIYMLPVFQIALSQKRIVLTCLFAISILFSGSSTGFVLMFVLLVYRLYWEGRKKWYMLFFGMAALPLIVFVANVVIPEVFLNNFDKLYAVTEGKSDNRLLGPLAYFPLLQSYEYVFGITLNQLANLMSMNGSFGYAVNYANAAIYMFISFGAFGFVTLVAYIVMKFRATQDSYAFLLIFIGIVCSDQILFNGNYFYLVVLVLMSNKINAYRKEIELKKA